MAKVDILNYISDSNILRSTYDTDTNELDITDVPQNLNSIITLGGGGGGGRWTDDDIASRNYTGDITIDGNTIVSYAFYSSGITSVSAPNYSGTIPEYAFQNCSSLQTVDMPSLYGLSRFVFADCTSLSSISVPNLQVINSEKIFENCSSLEVIVLPKATSIGGGNVFKNCTSLEKVDIGTSVSSMANNTFLGCAAMNTLIIRKNGVPTIWSTNVFDGTPFASDGIGGTLYVPSAQISNYQSATNWSAILGYANNQIKAIEGSQYETEYADGTPIGG